MKQYCRYCIFLSTYPVRGTTWCARNNLAHHRLFLSTYPVRGTTYKYIYIYRYIIISIHVPRAGYDASWETKLKRGLYFYPRTPCGVRPINRRRLELWRADFYPRTPCGVRPETPARASWETNFYPRTPCGVRQVVKYVWRLPLKFLSTYPVRGTTLDDEALLPVYQFLSTYPVRGTTPVCVLPLRPLLFLSTYPVRGTTLRHRKRCASSGHFYPRTPCGVRRDSALRAAVQVAISIHVPRAGYDPTPSAMFLPIPAFLSTYPVRGTTQNRQAGSYPTSISIHVPRAGYDWLVVTRLQKDMNFYPRTPCGVRPVILFALRVDMKFLSTYPVRGTTGR